MERTLLPARMKQPPDSLRSFPPEGVSVPSERPCGTDIDPGTPVHVYAFPLWKRRFVRMCFAQHPVHFLPAGAPAPQDGVLLLWGMAAVPAGLPRHVRVLRMEDGFLRSVGLGAELARPVSWVVDGRGIYYDATRQSDLEHVLVTADFSCDEQARARALRRRIVAARLTKYNVGHRAWQRPGGGCQVVLVPGQVETDASLAFGAPGIRTNMALLQAVRRARPEAFIVYKPHPDVAAGLRKTGQDEHQALRWCDAVVTDAPMADLLDTVDEVQVLTSLAGFEALLRDKPVVCHGQPFYSGWGLTQDQLPHPRRGRQRNLDELVAAALIAYPLYLGRDGGLITPEQALDELTEWKQRQGGRVPWWQGIYRFFLRRLIGVR